MNSKEGKKFSRLHSLTCLLKPEMVRALMRIQVGQTVGKDNILYLL